jgi:ribonuclease HII/SAM-dependent methyltransferase
MLWISAGFLVVTVESFASKRSSYKPLHQRRRNHPWQVELDILKDKQLFNPTTKNMANNNKDQPIYSYYRGIIGSDESGTGCIAGPIVTVSCCCVRHPLQGDNNNNHPVFPSSIPMENLRDGKQLELSECRRIYQHVVQNSNQHNDTVRFSVAIRSNAEIDALGSVQMAISDAFRESISTLAETMLQADGLVSTNHSSSSIPIYYSIVDGHRSPTHLPTYVTSRPWKGADATVSTVALASCMARAIHDICMQSAAREYPHYEFDQNRGYPTQRHIQELHQYGPCAWHRQSCKPVQNRMYTRYDSQPLQSRSAFLATIGMASACGIGGWTIPAANAMMTDPKTGVAFPEPGEIEASIPTDWSNIENPLTSTSLTRLDNSKDSMFYQDPRFVEHVDEQAVHLLSNYVSRVAIQPETQTVLDLCSSWTSHFTEDGMRNGNITRFAGLGMNAVELQANKALTDWTVQDLNENPKLPYPDNEFDVVLCQLSVDYLTKPLAVCREIGRVLKPRGQVHFLFSNRLFLSKAVAAWTGKDDVDHAFLVASYLHFCDGGQTFSEIQAKDLSLRRKGRVVGDPLYVVSATKLS